MGAVSSSTPTHYGMGSGRLGMAERLWPLRNDSSGLEEAESGRSAAGVQCRRIGAMVTAAPRGEDHQPGSSRIVSGGRSARCAGSPTGGRPLPLDSELAAGRANGVGLPAYSSDDSSGRVCAAERDEKSARGRCADLTASSGAVQPKPRRSTPTTAAAKGEVVSDGEEPARPRVQGVSLRDSVEHAPDGEWGLFD